MIPVPKTFFCRTLPFLAAVCLLMAAGCGLPNVKLFPDAADPLQECVLQGEGPDKIALLNINGVISDKTETDIMSRDHPSLLQEIMARMDLAEKDPAVKALVLKINSPGGTITASDIIYNRLMAYKQATGNPIVVSMMDVAASGGYYVALPADRILAHPTTVTGSVGVIFMRPKVYDLMDKIGLGVSVRTSGRNKDMGSPFREITEEEAAVFKKMIRDMGDRFVQKVKQHRQPTPADLESIATARIFSAAGALEAELIDRVGYLEEALTEARNLAGLSDDASVITYRRTRYTNDTIYNTLSSRSEGPRPSLVNIDLLRDLPGFRTGFYYLWWPPAGAGQ
ncbi:MAG: signal peptide peptidase SppA [Desulfosudaceae bacterium]